MCVCGCISTHPLLGQWMWCEWLVSCPGRFTPWEGLSGGSLNRRLVGPQNWSVRFGGESVGPVGDRTTILRTSSPNASPTKDLICDLKKKKKLSLSKPPLSPSLTFTDEFTGYLWLCLSCFIFCINIVIKL